MLRKRQLQGGLGDGTGCCDPKHTPRRYRNGSTASCCQYKAGRGGGTTAIVCDILNFEAGDFVGVAIPGSDGGRIVERDRASEGVDRLSKARSIALTGWARVDRVCLYVGGGK